MINPKDMIIVLFCVVLLVSIFYDISAMQKYIDQATLINECEQTLPRNQSCVLVAVPEVSDG